MVMWRFIVLLICLSVSFTAKSREIVDATGQSIDVPDHIERVIAAGPPAAIFLYSLAPDLMLGWPSRFNDKIIGFLGEPAKSMPVIGSISGKTGSESNIERLMMLKPDLIIDLGNSGSTNVSIAQRVKNRTKIPFLLYDGRLTALPHAYREVGALLGKKEEGEMRAEWIEKRLDKIKQVVEKVPYDKRPRIYYARGQSGLESGASQSIHAETIEFSGGRNVTGEAMGNQGILHLSMDEIMAFDPDMIVASDPRFIETIKSNANWQNLRAVKNGKVFVAPSLPFSTIDMPPSVNRVIGAVWLTNKLYPELYPVDMKSQIAEFYSLFYHVKLDEKGVLNLFQLPESK